MRDERYAGNCSTLTKVGSRAVAIVPREESGGGETVIMQARQPFPPPQREGTRRDHGTAPGAWTTAVTGEAVRMPPLRQGACAGKVQASCRRLRRWREAPRACPSAAGVGGKSGQVHCSGDDQATAGGAERLPPARPGVCGEVQARCNALVMSSGSGGRRRALALDAALGPARVARLQSGHPTPSLAPGNARHALAAGLGGLRQSGWRSGGWRLGGWRLGGRLGCGWIPG
jgi:hypothetical protein